MKAKDAVCTIFFLCLATAIASYGQTFTSLINFEGPNGNEPSYDSLVQGTDGDLYGTTIYGGVSSNCTSQYSQYGCGTVFKITPKGKLTTLYNFCSDADCADGYNPYGGLIVGANGNLYGTTAFGGSGGYCIGFCGTIFELTPAGKLTALHTFIGNGEGTLPSGALFLATDGNFYGTTNGGGVNVGGTVFELTPGGKLTTLYSFCSECGASVPYFPVAGLIQADNGNFYGTAADGRPVFEITAEGTLTSFDLTQGYDPQAALIQADNGKLYGTTAGGDGTIFELTPAGTPTTIYTFCSQTNCDDGVQPYGSLLQATNGNFYGTTFNYGEGAGCNSNSYNHGCGTIFELTPAAKLTTLHSFSSTGGYSPMAGLVQATNGAFYGTTTSGYGAIFRLDTGLGPFVKTIPIAAKPGDKVIILGTDLTGATGVTFNDIAAAFTVVSATEITATVPTGATTGKVEVTTPNGTLKSNAVFRVI
jgi:uncharacterized repeat protein (TIGR03803 family)